MYLSWIMYLHSLTCKLALSHWCIFHRKKARLVVETWDKQVRDVAKDQQTPLLYLANDILQNSRRRGGEFVTEFWRILPGTLKDVMEKGDERVHTVVFRLVSSISLSVIQKFNL